MVKVILSVERISLARQMRSPLVVDMDAAVMAQIVVKPTSRVSLSARRFLCSPLSLPEAHLW